MFYARPEEKDLRIEIEVSDIWEGAAAKVYANETYLGEIDKVGRWQFYMKNEEDDKDGLLHIELAIAGYGGTRNEGIKVKEMAIYAGTNTEAE